MQSTKLIKVLGILRISMGLIFLWAFFDKLLGLSFATTPEKAWLAGGSPTYGFLSFGVHGPFADFYHGLAGVAAVDWLFMLGLLFIGTSLTFGIYMKLGGTAGIAMMVLMYTAAGIQPENHPFIDDHFINALVILTLVLADSGKSIGFGNKWANCAFVQRHPMFR
ncbi:MAG: hypothetical protein KBC06_00375 [Candidatus Pacebacteria bacterium]|nr:hypothetical protein [Candidatus Paceibacterota bacterium]